MNKIWICPIGNKPDCSEFHMIGVDGGLKHIPAHLIQELEKKGFHQVVFPKRSYYYEMDKMHPSYRERERIGLEDTTELLEVEVV